MGLSYTTVDRNDMDDISLKIDLPAVVGEHVTSADDINELLLELDGGDVAEFVAMWITDTVNSDTFITALRASMYADHMLNIARQLIEAASQEAEDNNPGGDRLGIPRMLLQEIANRMYEGQAAELFALEPELEETLQNQLVGDYAHKCIKMQKSLELAIQALRPKMDDPTCTLTDRVDAAKQIGELQDTLAYIRRENI